MPSANTGDLSVASMGLDWKPGNSPSGDDALLALSLGDSQGVDVLVLVEDLSHLYLLLQVVLGPVNLLVY